MSKSTKNKHVFLSRKKMTNRAKAAYEVEHGEEALATKLKLRSPSATDMVAKRIEDKAAKRNARWLKNNPPRHYLSDYVY